MAPYLGIYQDVREPAWELAYTPMLQCPRDWRTGEVRWERLRSYTTNRVWTVAEDQHLGVVWDGPTDAAPRPPRIDNVRVPSQTIYITEQQAHGSVDSGTNNQWHPSFGRLNGWMGPNAIPARPDGTYYHGEAMTFLFVDSHASLEDPTRPYANCFAAGRSWWSRNY